MNYCVTFCVDYGIYASSIVLADNRKVVEYAYPEAIGITAITDEEVSNEKRKGKEIVDLRCII